MIMDKHVPLVPLLIVQVGVILLPCIIPDLWNTLLRWSWNQLHGWRGGMVKRNNLVDIWLPGNSKKAEREIERVCC
jgi:hypothetical protein